MAEHRPSNQMTAQSGNQPGSQPDNLQYPNLVFVQHEEGSSSALMHNTVISHGRRLQLDKKHRDKKTSAQQGATYARSLVGWHSSNTTTENITAIQDAAGLPKDNNQASPRRQRREPVEHEEPQRYRDVSPSTILKRGRSDPFNALAVEITPEVNEIVSFFRDYMILAFYHTKWETSKAAVVQMHWKSIVQALHDRGSALGWLGRNGQILSIVSKDNTRVKLAALRYTTQSTELLRKRLEQTTALSETDQWHISMLWGTEILFRNLNAALLHGRMIRRMVEDQAEKGTLDLIAFRYILYYDIHLCTMLMVRSVFDYFVWVPDKYRKLEPLATGLMRFPIDSEDDAVVGLDPCIRSEVLLPIFQQRRRHMREYAYWLERSFEALNPYLQAWLAICHHICHGQLITYALDCMDNASQAGDKAHHLLAEAWLSLTALYVTRTGAGGQLIVLGIDVFEARRSILDKLYTALRWVGDHYCLLCQNGKLWALYVGARGARTLKNKPDNYDWFGSEFDKMREQMGLSSWAQTQEVLTGFLHHESIDQIDGETPKELVE
ncbi:hypothetical protein PV04_04730 [Phialophora macrospora]|uniref:Uncharacterized protein n=1 Tax=Phialophora macrospora TaxID=1851006 RepID=A0A0D2GA17_9EURO|nr:hypothetical protein PV04_04730 [Phialophora macrospora]